MKIEIELLPEEFARLARVSSFCRKGGIEDWAKSALLDCAEIAEGDMIFTPEGELIGDSLEISKLAREVFAHEEEAEE